MGCPQYDDVNSVYAAVLSTVLHVIMAACMENFDRSISSAGLITVYKFQTQSVCPL